MSDSGHVSPPSRPASSLSESGPLWILVNPRAGGGRAARTARSVGEVLGAHGVEPRALHWHETHHAGDERRIARAAVEAGAHVLLAVGGDGTFHHAVHGLLEAPAPIPLALCAAGTGNDFVKNLAHDAHDPVAVAHTITRGTVRLVDIGTVNGIPFLNAAGVGFDADVAQRMQRGRRRGGRLRYLWHAGQALFGYRGFDARWQETAASHRHLMMVFANGHTFGGSFRIAPGAVVDDGALDAVIIGEVAPFDRPRLLLGALQGRHIDDPRVTVHRDRAFHVSLSSPITMECDGEVYHSGTADLGVVVRPHALPLLL